MSSVLFSHHPVTCPLCSDVMSSHTGAGTYDKVVSIEMIEAVGHEHLAPYFAVIGRMLKPGGRAVLQAISVPDDR